MDLTNQMTGYVSELDSKDEIIDDFNEAVSVIKNIVETKMNQRSSIKTYADVRKIFVDWYGYEVQADILQIIGEAINEAFHLLDKLYVIIDDITIDNKDEVLKALDDLIKETDVTDYENDLPFTKYICFTTIVPYGEKISALYRTTEMSIEAWDKLHQEDTDDTLDA